MATKRALGKGLSALLGDSVTPVRSAAATPRPAESPAGAMLGDREAILIPLAKLRANPRQPRKTIDQEALTGLAASIRQSGVLQPILVRRDGEDFELIAGERRFRAAQLAELDRIPALVCTLEESERLKVALLENIQRENLNAIEEAQAYRAVMDQVGATHQELADMLGKSRSSVTNLLRLLSLEEEIQEMVSGGALTMGHARCLVAIEDDDERLRIARRAAVEGWPVRALERKLQDRAQPRKHTPSPPRPDPDALAIREFENRLQTTLGSPARIRRRGEKGRIELQFFSNQELERLLETLGISAQL
jgi:ParB family chromosome partitioning protein